jgi:hypothetical protein
MIRVNQSYPTHYQRAKLHYDSGQYFSLGHVDYNSSFFFYIFCSGSTVLHVRNRQIITDSDSEKFYSKGTRVYLTIVHNNTESFIIYNVFFIFFYSTVTNC